MTDALLEAVEIETASQPRASVIWLHGLGADGYDFVPVVQELDLAGAPPIRFVFPHAPVRPVTINNGVRMRAWYDVYGVEGVRREDEAGVRASQLQVEALIDRETSRGIPAGRLVLAGFSQGGAIALQTALRHPEPLAGVLALSTYLPIAATVKAEATDASRQTPIFMAHGVEDPLIPIERARLSRDLLVKLGYRVEWHEYPMPHAVCDAEIRDIATWLRSVLRHTF
jgi:phospholipase/carboxylesterase